MYKSRMEIDIASSRRHTHNNVMIIMPVFNEVTVPSFLSRKSALINAVNVHF